MTFEYGDKLATIRDRQWAPADIDWDAPGPEMITQQTLHQLFTDVWAKSATASYSAPYGNSAPLRADFRSNCVALSPYIV